MRSSFTDHPDSIAGRISARRAEDALARLREPDEPAEDDEGPSWLDVTLDSTDEEIAAASRAMDGPDRPAGEAPPVPTAGPAGITACPLDPSWRRWDMFTGPKYWDAPAASQPAIDAAAGAAPARHLGGVLLDWERAADDGSLAPMTSGESGQPDWKYDAGSPRHLHAEAVIGGARVHVDWAYARLHGPGRSFAEIRIYVDGRLSGRGGRSGCALGFGRRDLPAVALLGDGTALTVDDVTGGALDPGAMPELVAERWSV